MYEPSVHLFCLRTSAMLPGPSPPSTARARLDARIWAERLRSAISRCRKSKVIRPEGSTGTFLDQRHSELYLPSSAALAQGLSRRESTRRLAEVHFIPTSLLVGRSDPGGIPQKGTLVLLIISTRPLVGEESQNALHADIACGTLVVRQRAK